MSSPALALVSGSDLIADLRQLAPDRTLTWSEAHSIAERQAALLLELSSITEPPVPQFVISSLPGVVVDWREDWPAEATSFHTASHWRIVIRRTDVRQRQRFSLAHELKHVLDDPVIEHLFSHLPTNQRQDRTERLCNYFAACLLMPRPWLKHDWCGGQQNVRALARRYYVSPEAMSTRLSELGLTPMSLALEPRQRQHWRAA
jgi:predicted transcriptional regulator